MLNAKLNVNKASVRTANETYPGNTGPKVKEFTYNEMQVHAHIFILTHKYSNMHISMQYILKIFCTPWKHKSSITISLCFPL